MAFDGTLKFDTAIDQTGFKLGLDKIGSIAKTGMAVVTAAVTAASGAVAALGGYAVSVGSKFESSMAQVIATKRTYGYTACCNVLYTNKNQLWS